MQCPYCLSLVEDEAVVCKVCTRDVYLFKPLNEKIRSLEEKLHGLKDEAALLLRIQELEDLLDARHEESQIEPGSVSRTVLNIAQCIFIPLALLLLAHTLITFVYDLNPVYLRIVSVVLPWPFAYYLFKSRPRRLLPWFLGSGCLALLAVIGMSAITGWIDHTPVLPQSLVEWREFLEYAISITFGFLTGMLLGKMAYRRAHPTRLSAKGSPLMQFLAKNMAGGKLSPDALQEVVSKLSDLGGTVVTIGSTAVSVYTGLKSLL